MVKNAWILVSYIILCSVIILTPQMSTGCTTEKQSNTFTELLKLLPATVKDENVITIIDYELFRQVNGLTVNDDIDQSLNRDEYVEKITAMLVDDSLFGYSVFKFGNYWPGGLRYVVGSPTQDEYIGYEITDVDAEINGAFTVSDVWEVFGSSSLHAGIVVIGDFSAQSTKDALENRSDWPSWAVNSYSSEDYDGITIHSWGNSNELHLSDRFKPPHLNLLGQAMPIAVADGELFVARSVEDIKSIIDATRNQVETLADLPEYVLVANAMYDLGAIGLIIIDEMLIGDMLDYREPYMGPQIKNFRTVGIGPGRDETGEYMALALVYENPEDADEGATLLEQKVDAFNELCATFHKKYEKIYASEIRTEDEVLLAKLYNNKEGLWYWWFFDFKWPMYLQVYR